MGCKAKSSIKANQVGFSLSPFTLNPVSGENVWEFWKGKQFVLAVLIREEEMRGSRNKRAEKERENNDGKFNFNDSLCP